MLSGWLLSKPGKPTHRASLPLHLLWLLTLYTTVLVDAIARGSGAHGYEESWNGCGGYVRHPLEWIVSATDLAIL